MYVFECKRLPRWTDVRKSTRSSLTWLNGTDSVPSATAPRFTGESHSHPLAHGMALPQKMDTPRIVRTMTPLTGTVSGGTLSTERTMSYRKGQHEFECKDISHPSRGRDCGIEEDERSDGPLS